MMPSAKIVICERLRPENMSYRPNIVFFAWSTSSASAWGLIPGVGMCPPTRYTASSPSVNSTRLRRSATAKMFFRLSASMVLSRVRRGLRHHLCRAAGGSDLFGRLAAELVRPYRERLGDVAAGEHLDVAALADEAVLAPQLRRGLGAGVEPLGDRIEVHHLVLDAERIV